jgi:hypothetical protein
LVHISHSKSRPTFVPPSPFAVTASSQNPAYPTKKDFYNHNNSTVSTETDVLRSVVHPPFFHFQSLITFSFTPFIMSLWRPDPNLSSFEFLAKIVCSPGHVRTERELAALTIDEREKVWADMTGDPTVSRYAEVAPEDPAMVQHCLQELQVELQGLAAQQASSRNNARNSALQRALQQQQQQQGNIQRAMRLAFLRAVGFNVPEAALKMRNHYEEKMKLFGGRQHDDDDSFLNQPITLQDLSPDDLQVLAGGGHQILSQPDRAGRFVCYARYHNVAKYHPHPTLTREHHLRAVFYLFSAMAEDIEVQRRGMIMMAYNLGQYPEGGVDYELLRSFAYLLNHAVPLRVVAAHMVCDNTVWTSIADLGVHIFSPFMRVRHRFHLGSDLECHYRLMGVGIQEDCLPEISTVTGEARTDNHLQWMHQRQTMEAKRRRKKQQQRQQQQPQEQQQRLSLHTSTSSEEDSGEENDGGLSLNPSSWCPTQGYSQNYDQNVRNASSSSSNEASIVAAVQDPRWSRVRATPVLIEHDDDDYKEEDRMIIP